MTKSDAEKLATEYLRQLGRPHELAIIPEKSRAESFGWVIFYNTKEFLETGNPDCALTGNAPLIVDAARRVIVPTGTAYPIDKYVAYYKAHGSLVGVHSR